jgi:hypothetical protein
MQRKSVDSRQVDEIVLWGKRSRLPASRQECLPYKSEPVAVAAAVSAAEDSTQARRLQL